MRLAISFMFLSVLVSSLKAQVFEQESIPETTDSYQFKKVNLDVKVGVAFPIRDFADSDVFTDKEVGAAKPGTCIGIEFNAKPVNVVGFGLDVSAVFNDYNTTPYDVIAQRDTQFAGMVSSNYFNLKMLGVFSIGIASENVEAELKLMGGPMYSRLPEQTFNYSYVSTNIRDIRKESNSIALCVGIGFSARYYVQSFYLKTFADYTSASVLHDVSYSATGVGAYGNETLSFSMSWMTIGAGIGIRF